MSKNLPTLKVKLAGFYRCVLNEGTDREHDTGWFPNLITDIGLDRLATVSPTVFSFSSIGTGTNAPANSDTSLQAFVAAAATPVFDSQSNGGPSAYIAQCQMHWVYAQGAVVGNMAEVGVGWVTGGVSLFSRARILDGGGSPTTLTVVSLDQLTVYYKLTCAPVVTDITGSLSISGTTYNYTGRLANAASFFANIYGMLQLGTGRFGYGNGGGGFGLIAYSTQTLGAITSNPSGTANTGAANANITVGSYTPGQKFLDTTFPCSPTEANASGGIGSVMLNFGGSQNQFQYSLANNSGGTPVPKDNTKTFGLTVRFAWDRV